MSDNKFDECVLFDCDEDTDSLGHDTPEGAIEAHFENMFWDGAITKALDEAGDVTVYGWKRSTIPHETIQRYARNAAEHIDEAYAEDEWADPDKQHHFNLGTLAADIAVVVADHISRMTVWGCERVAERVFTRDECEAILRKECPEWFEEEVKL